MKNNHALHCYYGDGKGKTTAAMGLAIRAAGQGRRVLVTQFMKTNTSGELNSLAKLENITFVPGRPIAKFTSQMTPEELAEERLRQHENYARVRERIEALRPQTIILDEILVAEHMGFLSAEEILADAERWLCDAEVIMTGHWCSEAMLERADYATEIVKRKHPFDHGVMARKGIEF